MIKTTNLHFTSKRLFMFMLKMCIRRLAAEVTKSMAGGSSWRQQEGWKKCLNGHSFKDKLLVINTCISPPPPLHSSQIFTALHFVCITLSQTSSAPSPFSCSCERRVSTLCWNIWQRPQTLRTCWSFKPEPGASSCGHAGIHKKYGGTLRP